MRLTVFALFWCLTASPAAAQQYSAQQEGDVVRLRDTVADVVVSVVPSVGNMAIAMTVKGHDVLRWPYASVSEFKARPGSSGIPFMAPWANRLDEPAFYANGQRHAFDLELGNIRGAPIPIHGFVTTTDRWQLVDLAADGSSAWATSRLDFYRYPDWMRQWPFAHTIEITYRLRDGALEVATTLRNMSASPMPVAVGFHPYFKLTDSPRDEWILSVGARTQWKLSATKVPTGETQPIQQLMPDPASVRLAEYDLDDVFGELRRDDSGRAVMSVSGRAQKLDVILGPNYRSVVIWAPNPAGTGRGSQNIAAAPAAAGAPAGGRAQQDRNFICIEPMAGITNAINLAHRGVYRELQLIPPRGVWQESFWVRPSGF
jgi:aldose 1-epimerase